MSSLGNVKRQFDVKSSVDRTIIIVGPSGAGKSEIINAIRCYCDHQYQPAKKSAFSVTEKTIISTDRLDLERNGIKFSVKIYDTRGITDSAHHFANCLKDWNTMFTRELAAVHQVVFVLPMDRLASSLLDELNQMTTRLVNWGMKPRNVVVLLNKIDFFTDDIVQDFINELAEYSSLPDILKKANIIPTCFLNPKQVSENIRIAADEKMTDSTNRLINALLGDRDIDPFYPREASLSIEEAQALDAKRCQLQNTWWNKCSVM